MPGGELEEIVRGESEADKRCCKRKTAEVSQKLKSLERSSAAEEVSSFAWSRMCTAAIVQSGTVTIPLETKTGALV